MPGIDTVSNTDAAAGGMDAEPDAALRTRFANFIDSRSRATPAAIAFAIQSLQQGLTYVLAENADPSGAARPGFFTVTVDDGSGQPPGTTMAAVSAALEAVRPVGSQFAVQPPTVVTADIALSIATPASTHAAAQANVAAAIQDFTSALTIGMPLPLSPPRCHRLRRRPNDHQRLRCIDQQRGRPRSPRQPASSSPAP